MIPKFRSNGYLPDGIHDATWAEVVACFGWSDHRLHLLEGLLRAARNLKLGGVKYIYLDGGFATKKKNEPKDYDGCWSIIEMTASDRVDPVLLDFDAPRDRMKSVYFGELVPAEFIADNIGTPYDAFFRKDRDGKAKGVVKLDLETLP